MHVDLPALIATYGCPVAFFGSMLEGETILALAGLAVHRGHLSFVPVWLHAAAGGAVGDAIYFAIGRSYGARILPRWPAMAPAADRVHRLIQRGPALAVVTVRFLYSLRLAGPIVVGSSPLPWPRFVFWNAIGALLWSACWLAGGYLLGEVAQRLIGNLAHIERELFLGVLVVAVVIIIVLGLHARTPRAPR